jgi:GAF domain-containing protein
VELFAGYCEPLGITSILDAGIFHDGRLTGVVCHEHIGPVRDWSSEERHFAESLADFIASRLNSSPDDNRSSELNPEEALPSGNERHLRAKAVFRDIFDASNRLKNLMEEDDNGSLIRKRLAVLNCEISEASSEALKLLSKP